MSIQTLRTLLRPARSARRTARPTSLHMELLERRATPAGLVAAYSFNEGNGPTVNDASGQLNNGTIVNAAWTTAGIHGGALSFNGTNALVNIPDSNSLDL